MPDDLVVFSPVKPLTYRDIKFYFWIYPIIILLITGVVFINDIIHRNISAVPVVIVALFSFLFAFISAYYGRYVTKVLVNKRSCFLKAEYMDGFGNEQVAYIDLKRAYVSYKQIPKSFRFQLRVYDNILNNWIKIPEGYFSREQLDALYSLLLAIKGNADR